jgi:hypothetical protein
LNALKAILMPVIKTIFINYFNTCFFDVDIYQTLLLLQQIIGVSAINPTPRMK